MRIGLPVLYLIVSIASVGLYFMVTAPAPSPLLPCQQSRCPTSAPPPPSECLPEPTGQFPPLSVAPLRAETIPSLTLNVTPLASPTHLTVWTNGSGYYDVYLLNQSEYAAFAASGTGPNGTVYEVPPSSFYRDTGQVLSSVSSFELTTGTWSWVVFSWVGAHSIALNYAERMC